ncbi:hypothetical protein V6R21_04830 [Limibacter armeniacum]
MAIIVLVMESLNLFAYHFRYHYYKMCSIELSSSAYTNNDIETEYKYGHSNEPETIQINRSNSSNELNRKNIEKIDIGDFELPYDLNVQNNLISQKSYTNRQLLDKYPDVVKDIQKGSKVDDLVQKYQLSRSTVMNIKRTYKVMQEVL